MLTFMRLCLDYNTGKGGRVDDTDGGWMRSERSFISLQKLDDHKPTY